MWFFFLTSLTPLPMVAGAVGSTSMAEEGCGGGIGSPSAPRYTPAAKWPVREGAPFASRAPLKKTTISGVSVGLCTRSQSSAADLEYSLPLQKRGRCTCDSFVSSMEAMSTRRTADIAMAVRQLPYTPALSPVKAPDTYSSDGTKRASRSSIGVPLCSFR